MRRQRMIAVGDRDAALVEARSARARMEATGYAADRTEADARAKILSDLSNAEADTRLREADLAKAIDGQQHCLTTDGAVTRRATVHPTIVAGPSPATGDWTWTRAAPRKSAAAQLFPRLLRSLLAVVSLQVITPPHSSASLRPFGFAGAAGQDGDDGYGLIWNPAD